MQISLVSKDRLRIEKTSKPLLDCILKEGEDIQIQGKKLLEKIVMDDDCSKKNLYEKLCRLVEKKHKKGEVVVDNLV